jgi:two-component system response regulator
MIERTIHVLLVEDDPGDVMLTKKLFADVKPALCLDVVNDGVEAMAYLRREAPYTDSIRPDLLLLDLNMPKKDGCTVLKELQQDAALRSIPVVVLTTSDSDSDIERAYGLGANCYITKPVGVDQFARAINSIENFWFTIVKLMPRKDL